MVAFLPWWAALGGAGRRWELLDGRFGVGHTQYTCTTDSANANGAPLHLHLCICTRPRGVCTSRESRSEPRRAQLYNRTHATTPGRVEGARGCRGAGETSRDAARLETRATSVVVRAEVRASAERAHTPRNSYHTAHAHTATVKRHTTRHTHDSIGLSSLGSPWLTARSPRASPYQLGPVQHHRATTGHTIPNYQ